MNKILYIIFLFLFLANFSTAQTVKIYGHIKDNNDIPLEFITIQYAEGKGTTTDKNGYYEFGCEVNIKKTINYSGIGYIPQTKIVTPKNDDSEIKIDIVMEEDNKMLDNIDIIVKRSEDWSMTVIDKKNIGLVPSASGNTIIDLLKTNIGVASGNELSSQYNVRGGNFDENIVYINDIEIYRPFLVRSGQQEGLSFINSDLVANVDFSAGGFDAKYGDKMSSVLDIVYKKPHQNAASLSVSLLGATAHAETVSNDRKWTFISGIRYKKSKYILNSLQVDGNYNPQFFDFQNYVTYNPNKKIEIGLLTNIADNKFIFEPTEEEASFGTFQQALKLSVFYQGQEQDKFTTYFGACNVNYKINNKLTTRFTTSAFLTNEVETYDIYGAYRLNELNNQIGSDELGDSTMNLGFGSYLEHARNYLQAKVINIDNSGTYFYGKHKLLWGVKWQHENIIDRISEWEYIDSAGFSINSENRYNPEYVTLNYSVRANNNISSNRVSAFIQNIYKFDLNGNFVQLTSGLRATFWDFNNQLNISPRAALQIRPQFNEDLKIRIATGVYYQPPFYREMRKYDGTIFYDCKAQQSTHLVVGTNYTFLAWGRPFEFITEIYYKFLNKIIPYELDNVKIRYYADQTARGYARGLDMKVHGEFVESVDSWISVSLMQTKEDIVDDFYWQYLDEKGKITYNRAEAMDSLINYPSFIPRPTDQIFNVGLFFQDYVPGNKNFKVHLSFIFNSPVPYGPPNTARYNATLRSYPAYLRTDIGFSVMLKNPDVYVPVGNPMRIFKSIWLSGEVLNLLKVRNTVSYSWITVVPNTSNPVPMEYSKFPVPNKLTGRIINVRLILNF